MRFNRSIWTDGTVRKPCPTCIIGVLIPNDKLTLKNETNNSLGMIGYGGHNYTEYVFSLILKCSNCSESVSVLGKITEADYYEENSGEIATDIRTFPIAFFPTPKIIDLPKSCPKSVSKILNESFGLYWIDIGSCANKIRISIEVLLDEHNVPNSKPTSKGKIKYFSLNERIVEFEKNNLKVGGFLHAIKWIGNEGSHSSEITRDDVLDAYELMDYSLENLYPEREQNILTISQKIIDNKFKPKP